MQVTDVQSHAWNTNTPGSGFNQNHAHVFSHAYPMRYTRILNTSAIAGQYWPLIGRHWKRGWSKELKKKDENKCNIYVKENTNT